MTIDATNHRPPKQAEFLIDFLIIGAGISGLSCAIALRRVGHRVTVLEKDVRIDKEFAGCRIPPNFSKILFHWGLGPQLRSIALKSQSIQLVLQNTGELLGTHIWDEEILKETQGEYMFAHVTDIRKLLYSVAVKSGVKVKLGAEVASIDCDGGRVTLTTGKVITADVVVGADGPSGISRRTVLGEDAESDNQPAEMCLYSAVIPKSKMFKEAELKKMFEQDATPLFLWFGSGCACICFPMGGRSDFGVYVYGPSTGKERSWFDTASTSEIQELFSTSEPRLRQLAKLMKSPFCVPVSKQRTLEDWVEGRLILIGAAAHPLPPGSNQDLAMGLEDGAVLAKVFSHLKHADQIESFLYGFEDVRQPRINLIVQMEAGILEYMTMPPSEFQEQRDSEMRRKRDANIGVLDAGEGMEETPEWVEIKDVFGYDAEDAADEWWQEWGLLRERARMTSDD